MVAQQAAAAAKAQSLRTHGENWAMAGVRQELEWAGGSQEAPLCSNWEVRSVAQVGARGEICSLKAVPKTGSGVADAFSSAFWKSCPQGHQLHCLGLEPR